MCHQPRQRRADRFTVQRIEVVGLELISVGGADAPVGELQLHRWCQSGAAAPAAAGGIGGWEGFLAAVLAQLPLIQAVADRLLPLAGEGALVGLVQPWPEALHKQALQRIRIDRPGDQRSTVLDRIGAVGAVVGIKNEEGFLAVDPPPRRFIQAADGQFLLAAEGIVARQQPKEQHRQGEQVATSAWPGQA